MNSHYQRLSEILNSESYDLLIYTGGSGGDFLTYLLNKYTDGYYKHGNIKIDPNTNRCFYDGELGMSALKIWMLDPNTRSRYPKVEDIYPALLIKAGQEYLHNEIDKWYESFKVGERFMVRSHDPSTAIGFAEHRQYVLKPDTEYWQYYTQCLKFIKIDTEKIYDSENHYVTYKCAFDFLSKWEPKLEATLKHKFATDVSNHKVEFFYNGVTKLLARNKYDQSCIDLTPNELFLKLQSANYYNTSSIEIWNSSVIREGMHIIKMSDILTSKSSSPFNSELASWHTRNLNLLKEYDFK